ncbi:glucose-repressible alcohol dehydrogenase transcriptional effector [Eremomyces bilateralis CBS 781.70]|uniref:CCR4-Not complex 3'-5'-exoribonuclease subunit Ccr4 n=1 Tax=Eremomyces bilateralis CBS 781.70 TaxID=1392243 RepID=A0A6G1FY73_9PEZI|nr:glucose-repressible alcohol dehydrogenase transcriptional effector [Eremomyces bilateralis CBS 781.70]KAF1810626.1 glucose-repressible alcohol dehydrogenase transcriptional effector [Eremomyces bilateralis CBS 781.70]
MFNQNDRTFGGGQGHHRYGMQHTHLQNLGGVHQHQNFPHGSHARGQNSAHRYTSSGTPLSLAHQYDRHAHEEPSGSHIEELDESGNEQWKEHIKAYREYMQSGTPHYHAKTFARRPPPDIVKVNAADEDNEDPDDRSRAAIAKPKERSAWAGLDLSGQGLRLLSSALFRFEFLEELHLDHNKLVRIPPEIGRLKNLIHLDISNNLLVELPGEIGLLSNLQELLLFDNSLEHLPVEIGYLFRLRILGIRGNPIDHDVGPEIKEAGTENLIKYYRNRITPPPHPDRDWIGFFETSDQSQETFTALSYNILCQRAGTSAHHGCVPDKALSWDYRRDLILRELENFESDFICLQEFDAITHEDFRQRLRELGYASYYSQRTRSRYLNGEQARLVDGCGTFWKTDKYISLASETLRFGELGLNDQSVKKSADYINRVWQKDHIALVNLLENRVTGTRLILVNAYIFWNPKFKDVKLIQVAVLLREITQLAEQWADLPPVRDKRSRPSDVPDAPDAPDQEFAPSSKYTNSTDIPLVICGDFNSEPTSAVYDLVARGSLPAHHDDLDGRDYGPFSTAGMSHPLTLKSAYGAVGELPFTNYTPDYQGVLDYIWYSSNTVRVKGLLGEVDREYLRKVPGFPDWNFPSDHLPLVAEFAVTPRRKGAGKM